MAYRLVFEYGYPHAFPRYFEPTTSNLSYADSLRAARQNARAVVGKTRLANLPNDCDPAVIERRRNRRYVVTIRDVG